MPRHIACRFSMSVLALAALTQAAPASAAEAAASSVRVRGTVESLAGSTLTVKSREGKDVAITLKDGWKVTGLAKASLDAIKPGDYVGVASAPKTDGVAGALEVLVFPKGMEGTGEGSFPWDVKPNSTMTNATVANAVEAVDGRSLTLSYNGGTQKKVEVPAATPVVTFAAAETSDIVPGATVFVPSEQAADKTLSTGFVVVGKNGVVPPM